SRDRTADDRYRPSSGRGSSVDRFERSDQSRFSRRGPAPFRGGQEKTPSRGGAPRSSKGEDWRAPKPRWGSRPRLSERPARAGSRQDTKPETTNTGALSEAEGHGASAADDLLWGRHATQAALEARRPIHRIWCTTELRSASRFLQLLRDAKASGVLVEEVSWARLGQLTGGAVHQGIALQVASAETLDLSSLIEGCADLGESPLLLALDGLTDPHNLGAIVRSAEALGAHGVVLPQRRSAGLTGSVAKVAAGALEHLPVARVVNLNRSLETLKDKGYRVLGLAEEGDLTLAEADLEGPLVLVTGSEDQGLSLLTRRHCDQLIRIPLRGMTPNLNASVATALCLFEVARRGWMKGLRGQAPSPRIIRPRCSPSLPEVQPPAGTVAVEDQVTAESVDADPAVIKATVELERIDLDDSALPEHFDGHIQL
ncbi:MAG: 23S rRNA (guanosine(2251)-2'-O)-methyltransferase RlmB, partial [Roseibacillus sp.]|nr:23S rRNA (guanosine(2251)-2'-O)-methyltransferase RlmB [Roseibacillus sp.]